MKRLATLVLFAALTLLFAQPAHSQPPPIDGPAQVTGHILVRLDGAPSAALAGRLEHVFGDWYRLTVAAGHSVATTMTWAAALPGVDVAYPDTIATVDAQPPALAPNDPLYTRQWHMPQVQAEAAWEVTTGAEVVVAVLDTGIRSGGPDGFCNPLHSEYNTMTNSTAPGAARDNHSHGTHVAGTIAGCANNGIGGVGLAYGVELMAVKVLSDSGSGSNSNVAEGIVWAADHGAQVINMSLGSACTTTWPACSTPIVDDAIEYAAAADVVIVVSAGNSNRGFAGTPGNHPEVITVAATDVARARAWYSNWGEAIDITAPGGDTTSGVDLNNDGFPDGVYQETFNSLGTWGYYDKQGTSMSAPHVAGAAALLRACVPEALRDEVRDALLDSADDLAPPGYDTTFGHGFLQAYDALVVLAGQFQRDVEQHCQFTGEPPCLTVTTAAAGAGSVTVAPDADCDAGGVPGYSYGTALTFTPTPDAGHSFAGWSGDAGGTADPLQRTIYRDLSLTATFLPCLSVTTHADGPGSVGVSPAPNCGGEYRNGTALTLTATPTPGHRFTGWSGGATGTINPLQLMLTADLDVTASFAEIPVLAISLLADGSAGGLAYRDEDVLRHDGAWSMRFDGSAYKLPGDVDALAVLANGDLLLSPDATAKKLPGLGNAKVDDSDVVRFTPATGRYAWYFDGSDVGLSTNAEDVDALAVLPDGRLLISTEGAASVPGVAAADEDVLVFTPTSLGASTAGSWAIYVDGGDLSAALDDVDGVAFVGGDLYLSALSSLTLGGQTVAPGDVFVCRGIVPGASTACASLGRYWQGLAAGLPAAANVDGLEVLEP